MIPYYISSDQSGRGVVLHNCECVCVGHLKGLNELLRLSRCSGVVINVLMCVFRYTWCLNCGRRVSVWIMVTSETTAILEMPTSLRQSEGGENTLAT